MAFGRRHCFETTFLVHQSQVATLFPLLIFPRCFSCLTSFLVSSSSSEDFWPTRCSAARMRHTVQDECLFSVTPANRTSRGTGDESDAAAIKAFDVALLGAVSCATANNPVRSRIMLPQAQAPIARFVTALRNCSLKTLGIHSPSVGHVNHVS